MKKIGVLIYIMTLTIISFGQLKPTIQIGVGYVPYTTSTFKLAGIYDNQISRQYEFNFYFGLDFNPKFKDRLFMVQPNCNFYLKKRSESSKKVFVGTSIGPVFQYTERNYSLYPRKNSNYTIKRIGIGALPGININYQFVKKFSIRADFKIGVAYLMEYGPKCTGVPFEECFENSPQTMFDLFSIPEINIFYKF